MGNRHFKPEFKQESAALLLDHGHTHQEACASMGIGPTAMRRWVVQPKAERDGETPKRGRAITQEPLEIQKLKKQIKRLEVEKEILKKATALLMSDTLNVTR
jgi:transposase